MGLLDWSPVASSTDDLPNFNAWGPPPSRKSSRCTYTSTPAVAITRCPTNNPPASETEPFPLIESSAASTGNSSSAESMSSTTYSSHVTAKSHLTAPQPSSMSMTDTRSHSAPPTHTKSRIRSRSDTGRPRSTSFDLFGDDDELQDAESRIGFCDICLKQCEIHDTRGRSDD